METQLLRDSGIIPSPEVLKVALGEDVYEVFDSFIKATTTGTAYGLTCEWKYYNDGSSWLCKMSHKKKTVLWLSVWKGFFKTSFYFTEKHRERISALNIAQSIKEAFCSTKPVGRLLPMLIQINCEEQLTDLLKVITFKKNLK